MGPSGSAGFRSDLAWYNTFQYRVAKWRRRLVGIVCIKCSIWCTAGEIFFSIICIKQVENSHIIGIFGIWNCSKSWHHDGSPVTLSVSTDEQVCKL